MRDFEAADAPSIAKYADNPKIAAKLRDCYTLIDAKSFLESVSKQSPRTVFAIADRKEAIGSIGLMMGEDVHMFSAELGYWLAEPYWGQGIMSDTVRAVVEYGFQELGLVRIYAAVSIA